MMNKKSVFTNCLSVLVLLAVSSVVAAEDASRIEALEARILQLEKVLEQLLHAQKSQSQKIESVNVKVTEVSEVSRLALKRDNEAKDNTENNYAVAVYGSLRPRLTFRDEAGESSSDVTDALSRIGFKGDMAIGDSVTAFYQGEWDVDIESKGNFGDARLAHVGVKGDFGRVAIGQQWSPHYNLLTAVTDIFNHRSSPFAYDNVGPYRTSNLVTYSVNAGGIQFDSSIQVNGNLDISGNSGDESQTNRHNHIDSGSVGIGYNFGPVYVGSSYLEQQLEGSESGNAERHFLGLATSWNPSNDVYLALTYQDITVEESGLQDLDQFTLDLVGAYSFGYGYKIKAGYFSFEDDLEDAESIAQDGYNLTFERQIGDFRLFMEWLHRDFEARAARKTLSLGFRYDFEKTF